MIIRACWRHLYSHPLFIRYLFNIYLSGFWLEEIITSFGEASKWYLLVRKYIYYKKKNHCTASSVWCSYFDFFNLSNWRVLSENQDEELQSELELNFLHLNCRFVLFCHLVMHHCMSVHKKTGSFRPSKHPRVEQRWYINLQQDVRTLLISLQVGCVSHEDPTLKCVLVGWGIPFSPFSCLSGTMAS